jgi:hypothetical protein
MRFLIGLALFAVPAPTSAANYVVTLAAPPGGAVLRGYGGLHAVDARSEKTLVRVISPGSAVGKRGTIRVLVLNLGTTPFPFGPEQVSLEVGSGQVLAPVAIDEFIRGAELVERERNRARTIEIANGGAAGLAARTGGARASGSFDFLPDEAALPGTKTLDAIYQVLETQIVEPTKGWGGYYVFNVPKAVRASKADQHLTITVTTGSEVRRFTASLRHL